MGQLSWTLLLDSLDRRCAESVKLAGGWTVDCVAYHRQRAESQLDLGLRGIGVFGACGVGRKGRVAWKSTMPSRSGEGWEG